MFLFVFHRAKRRSGLIAKFQFLTSADSGIARFNLQKLPESADAGGVFPDLYCCAKAGF